MAIKDALLPEFDEEMKTTRKLLEVLPETDANWKPHAKSMSTASLATHVVNLLNWFPAMMRTQEIDYTADLGFKMLKFESRAQLLQGFEALVQQARAAITSASDETLAKQWTLRAGDRVIFSLPRAMAIRIFVMNHHIHHRAQLSVYLRLRDVPLPAMYGPTADT